MTQINVFITPRGRFTGFNAIGHTLYAFSGSDIVCAGVSTLMQSAVNSLASVAHVTPHIVKKPGLLSVRVNKSSGMRWHDTQVILRSCVRSLLQLSAMYPKNVRLRWHLDESAQYMIRTNHRIKEVRHGKVST